MTKSSILILILSSKKQVNSQNSVYGIWIAVYQAIIIVAWWEDIKKESKMP